MFDFRKLIDMNKVYIFLRALPKDDSLTSWLLKQKVPPDVFTNVSFTGPNHCSQGEVP